MRSRMNSAEAIWELILRSSQTTEEVGSQDDVLIFRLPIAMPA
jgi:hypothetical protein